MAAAQTYPGSVLGGVNVRESGTEEEVQLGSVTVANNGVWAFVTFSGSVSAGATVTVASNFVVSEAGADDTIFGVCPYAASDGEYGWVCVSGYVSTAKVPVSTSAGTAFSLTSAGSGTFQAVPSVDESSTTVHTAGDLSARAFLLTATDGGTSVSDVFLI